MQTAFLRAYLLTVDTGSMAEAARRLHLTPAAVAQQIRSLEQEIGVALVRRAGHSVRPTEGLLHRILEKARRLLRDAGELASLAGQDELCAELRLGSIYTALDALVAESHRAPGRRPAAPALPHPLGGFVRTLRRRAARRARCSRVPAPAVRPPSPGSCCERNAWSP